MTPLTDPKDKAKISQEKIEQLIQQRVSLARKEEALEIYEDLVQTIWNRIQPTLGRVTVMAIMERTRATTGETYPIMNHLQVAKEGLVFDTLQQHVGDEEVEVIREALKEFIATLIDILAMLTGDILVQQLIKEIEGRQS